MLEKHSNAIHCMRLSLPLNTCKMVHISFSNVVHSILCSNLLLLIMNHMTRPESGYEVVSKLGIVSSLGMVSTFVDLKLKIGSFLRTAGHDCAHALCMTTNTDEVTFAHF